MMVPLQTESTNTSQDSGKQSNISVVVMPSSQEIVAYQLSLMKVQQQQQLAALSHLLYDVPLEWHKETTYLKYSQAILCIGTSQIYAETEHFGRIEFIKGECKCYCCSCNCLSCLECFGHTEMPFKFTNIPNPVCPIQIEMCCYKTALIRYKGVVLGRVEKLNSGACATKSRFIIKPIDPDRPQITLLPDCDILANCLSFLPCCECNCTKTINVQRNDIDLTNIKNSHIKNSCCTCPWSLKYAPYAKGVVNFEGNMKQDEKILLLCGWVIQQAYMSYII